MWVCGFMSVWVLSGWMGGDGEMSRLSMCACVAVWQCECL